MAAVPTIEVDGNSLDLGQIVEVARGRARVRIAEHALDAINRSRAHVEDLVKREEVAYGITTGYGPLVNRLIPPKQAAQAQHNLIQSLSGGVGEPFSIDVARAVQLIRLNSLCKGHSGIRLSTLQVLADLLNADIAPYIPESGSVGASGDLCPLAHMTQALLGQGQVFCRGELVDAQTALEAAGIEPVTLSYKEGLALINGTSVMSAIFALALRDARDLTLLAEACTAFAADVLHGNIEHFDPRIADVRPHPGQLASTANLNAFLEGSQLVLDPAELQEDLVEARGESEQVVRVEMDLQSPYSIRCVPQIVGAVRDLLSFVDGVLRIEVNSVTDNPLIFAEDETTLHGGNFYGQHVSFASDILGLAITKLALLSERRFARYIDENFSQGLPPFLVIGGEAGLSNGFMGIQLVTTALVAEIRNLNDSASVSSIPTNANNQDVVSMGTPAAKKLFPMLEKARALFAYELVALAQAADYRGPEKLGRAGKLLHESVRRVVPALGPDRPFRPDIQALVAEMVDGDLVARLETTLLERGLNP